MRKRCERGRVAQGADPGARARGDRRARVEQQKLGPEVDQHIRAIGHIDPGCGEGLAQARDRFALLSPLQRADGEGARRTVAGYLADCGDVAQDPRNADRHPRGPERFRRHLGRIDAVLHRHHERVGADGGGDLVQGIGELVRLDGDHEDIGGADAARIVGQHGGAGDGRALRLDEREPARPDRGEMRAARDQGDGRAGFGQLRSQVAADAASAQNGDLHVGLQPCVCRQPLRPARIRPRIARAASGMLVPGPKMAETPAFFR